MFLSNRCNIKEVLLYPAMKPEDPEAIAKQKALVAKAKSYNDPSAAAAPASGGASAASAPAFPPSAPCPATVGGAKVDVATPAGLAAVTKALGANTYLGG
jgi:hypothetical protein